MKNFKIRREGWCAIVASMSEKIQSKEGARQLLPVPAAHSAHHLCGEETDSRRLASFQELKSDVVILSEVTKRIYPYDHQGRHYER